MNEKFLSPYDPNKYEDNIYDSWQKSGFFDPDRCVELGVTKEDAEAYSIVLPPPNVTGVLHMGHAAMLAIEDILVRYNRMQGKRALWVPGTDSAAVATQAKVEKELYKSEKKTRYDLGREELIKRIVAFSEESKNTIIGQTKKMGASLDWSRYAYTLDEKRYEAVMTAFKRMYDAGLIYRGSRIVNWDPNMQTTISDDEIEYVEQTDKFYYLKYGPFVIGTARPETKFGDKYVVMHPDDARYKEYVHGQQIDLEWINGPITATVVKDASIDMEFGTGVMTITPWHSQIDYEIAERHNLEKEQIIDERGILLPIAGEFAGQHIKKARALIIAKLETKGLVSKIEETYVHNVATNSRGGGTIEPQVKTQWFVDVNKEFTMGHSEIPGVQEGDTVTLKSLMHKAVEGGGVTIFPERFAKVYDHWIDNLRDWCISRQIWYGHRIPVWYRGAETYCGLTAPQGDGWEQDPDTLDTWFSSGLWTFSTLGWPQETKDLKTYHPTAVLETGYDILFFWVARMVLMSTFHLGQVPFKNVYLHGLVRDNKGRKMSKSLGNIIDPLDMIAKYGADATRLSVVIGAGPGSDINLSEDKVRGYKKYTNKIWNIARFILTHVDAGVPATAPSLSSREQEILDEWKATMKEVDEHIRNYRLHLAGEKLYDYTWHTFADVILEESKDALASTDVPTREARIWLLVRIFSELLAIQHPFIPFITEEIWKEFPNRERPLIVTSWPL